jgi:hypothetical protein
VEIELSDSATGATGAASRLRRRTVIGVGVGAAASLLPMLSARAGAATARVAGAGDPPPPQRPTDADIEVLAALQQIELSVLALYDQAIALSGWPAAQAAVVTTFRESHAAYAQAIGALLGGDAPGEADQALVDRFATDFGRTPTKAMEAAVELESALVATHLAALGLLEGTDGAALVASIQIAEARHTTVLAEMTDASALADLLVDSEQASLLKAEEA